MKSFIYKAKKGPDNVVEGTLYANNKQEIVEKLLRSGCVATSVEEVIIPDRKAELNFTIRSFVGVKLKDIIVFSRQLADLLRAGIPILRALSILAEQAEDPYFKSIIVRIGENVRMGYSLSSGLEEFPKVFSLFYRAMIAAGERSGSMDKALTRISEYYRGKYELVSKVRTAMAYPLMILIVGILSLVFIFTNVIPKIIPLIINLNAQLPVPNRILIGTSEFLKNNIHWVILWILLFSLIFARAMTNKTFKYYFSRMKLGIPVIGDIIFKSELAQFSNTVAMALASGISMIQGIDISMPILKEYAIIKSVKGCSRGLEAGGSFGDALKASGSFPPFFYNLVKVGEESGDLENALANIVTSYEADCEEGLKIMTNLLEPVMILAVGLIVGFIVIAVLLPIMSLNFIGL